MSSTPEQEPSIEVKKTPKGYLYWHPSIHARRAPKTSPLGQLTIPQEVAVADPHVWPLNPKEAFIYAGLEASLRRSEELKRALTPRLTRPVSRSSVTSTGEPTSQESGLFRPEECSCTERTWTVYDADVPQKVK